MRQTGLRRLAGWMLAGAAVLLHGCAVVTAPGFDFADPKTRTSITLGQYVATDASAPPQGMITEITPTVVRAQNSLKADVVPPSIQRLFADPEPYTIGVSDIISIVVYDHPELLPQAGQVIGGASDPTGISSAPGFIVDSQGMVTFPYAGRVPVVGLTEAQAAEAISKRISKVIKDPQVSVRINSFRSKRAYVDGEVRQPGTQVFTDVPMTLAEAISRAGGVTATGDRSFVTLTRNNETTVIDMLRLQELGVNPNRIVLKSGDLVTVRHREDRKVYVMGEVMRPAGFAMRNGRMTLNEALAEGGGPNLTTANTNQVYVIRQGDDSSPIIYHLNANNPTALALAESFYLRPRDVVYIDPVPLVAWNRIISLILPSAQTLITGRQLVNP